MVFTLSLLPYLTTFPSLTTNGSSTTFPEFVIKLVRKLCAALTMSSKSINVFPALQLVKLLFAMDDTCVPYKCIRGSSLLQSVSLLLEKVRFGPIVLSSLPVRCMARICPLCSVIVLLAMMSFSTLLSPFLFYHHFFGYS